jgi:hypothetical protein
MAISDFYLAISGLRFPRTLVAASIENEQAPILGASFVTLKLKTTRPMVCPRLKQYTGHGSWHFVAE